VLKDPGLLPARKKREYKKRKHKQAAAVQPTTTIPPVRLQNYIDVGTVLHRGRQLSSDEELSGASQSDHEAETDPDGVFAFRRKAGCCYHSPRHPGEGSWPWSGVEVTDNSCYRYCLTAVPSFHAVPPTQSLLSKRHECCVGFVRRRIGRGGRVVFDRGYTEWDEGLTSMSVDCATMTPDSLAS